MLVVEGNQSGQGRVGQGKAGRGKAGQLGRQER